MTEWTNVVPTFREIADAPPPEMPLVCFPDIDNGDCVYFCLWQLLHMLMPHATTRSLTKAALGNNMRDYLCQFVQNRWSRISVISNMSWCELVTLSQNTAVSEVETLTYGSWGTTDAERLSAWITERDQMFGGLVDITALVEILAERDVFLSVRIWRINTMDPSRSARQSTHHRVIDTLLPIYCIRAKWIPRQHTCAC